MEFSGLASAMGESPQQQPQRACPRCSSNNTKFCYFNNYSLSQPRYFCKGCRRYWTHGGTLRNVPVGGSSRKSKRSRDSGDQDANPVPSPSSSASSMAPVMGPNLFQLHGAGGGLFSTLAGSQSMRLHPPIVQQLPTGWKPSFVGAGSDGIDAPFAAAGAQFWTLGGPSGSAGSPSASNPKGGCS